MSGWPSGLRRQTQASASHLWGFWSPNGGVGSNPTSDTSSFCSYNIQNKSVGKFLIFLGPDSENSPVKESWNTFRITWRQPPALPSEIPLLLEKKRTITTCGLFLSGSTDESSTVGCWVFTVERMNEILTAFLYTEKNLL